MNKQKLLAEIANQILLCAECKENKIGIAVPGSGNPDAKIMFIGEAPGKTEAQTGQPFVGRSGKFLRTMIRELGLDDEKDVFITSPVKYLPEHGTPRPKEVKHGREHLLKQLNVINPLLIVLMGNIAVLGGLGEKIMVKSRHGELIEQSGRKFFITLHPAAGLRFPALKLLITEDFIKLKKIIKSL